MCKFSKTVALLQKFWHKIHRIHHCFEHTNLQIYVANYIILQLCCKWASALERKSIILIK